MAKKMKIGLLFCLLQGLCLSVWAKDYYVTDFGAKADGVTLNTLGYERVFKIIRNVVDEEK